jgi:hypothetical protein
MPLGKEIGSFSGKITSVRVLEINGEERVIEGTYEAELSGQMAGTGTGTLTFRGLNDRGTVTDLGVGYLASGDVPSARGQGVYFLSGKGQWEVRSAYLLGDQPIVSEGQITLKNGSFSLKGKIFELT